jgi:outer membrane lipoprotein-sorting protein
MSTFEVMMWIVFILVVSLLFFAAFGSQNVSHESIEEYMNELVNEESERVGP